MDTTTQTSHYQRCVKELCELVGFKKPELVLQGGKLRIDDYLVSLIHDETHSPAQLFVYIDMGPAKSENRESTYTALLKINFDLLGGSRGAIGLQPETDHIFHSFCYPLNEDASGKTLLDTMIRCIGDIGTDLLDLPGEMRARKASKAAASRSRATRILKTTTEPPPGK